MNNIECPYCQHEFENYTDPFDQQEEKEMQCPTCEKYFMVRCTYSASYESYVEQEINQRETL